MSSEELKKKCHLFCTGQPGCGKTTLVRQCLDELMALGLTVSGFVTDEVLSDPNNSKNSSREGFDIIAVGGTLSGNGDGKRGTEKTDGDSNGALQGVLARKHPTSGQPKSAKTGQYFVNVESFESVAVPALALRDDIDVYVIDEVGRMELHSERFKEAVTALLAAGRPIVGALTAPIYGHRVKFVDEIAERGDVEVVRLKASTRGAAGREMSQKLHELFQRKDAQNDCKKGEGDVDRATERKPCKIKKRRIS
mmetsp:Transcript_26032/g.31594  ORF Transcript_26032/g.31594 Transcript_26032/m.31594 type:complete len:252 (+) Transcript_26032:938-1693(+)